MLLHSKKNTSVISRLWNLHYQIQVIFSHYYSGNPFSSSLSDSHHLVAVAKLGFSVTSLDRLCLNYTNQTMRLYF